MPNLIVKFCCHIFLDSTNVQIYFKTKASCIRDNITCFYFFTMSSCANINKCRTSHSRYFDSDRSVSKNRTYLAVKKNYGRCNNRDKLSENHFVIKRAILFFSRLIFCVCTTGKQVTLVMFLAALYEIYPVDI